MKEIYQDGHIPSGGAGKEFEDISSKSKPSPPPVHPTRPKKHPTATPLDKQKAQQQAAQQAQMPSMGYNPYMPPYMAYPPMPPQTPTAASPTQNSIPDTVDYSTGIPYAQYQPYPYYPQPMMYPPQGYMPQQVNTAPPKMEVAEGSDPGMRVLYQSADFDSPADTPPLTGAEDYPPVTAPYQPEDAYPPRESYQPAPPQRPAIIHSEDVSFEEVTIDQGVSDTSMHGKAFTPEGVSIDDMEMSAFELGAMAQKKHTISRAMKKPGISKTQAKSLPVTEDVEVEEFLSFALFEAQEEAEETKKAEAKQKKIPTSEIIRRVVLGIALAAMVIASAVLINEWRLSRENSKLEEEFSNQLITEATTTKKNKNDKTTKPDEDTTKAPTVEEQWEQLRSEYPNIVFPANLQLKYAKLYAQNQDFVGYLSADGVNLNLPVVQTDDDEYYLKKNFYGKNTKYGCPFVTHLNNIDPLDMNTVIFGHHMNDGTVFGALDAYKTIEGFKKAPVITFDTLYSSNKWKVIAAFITNAEPEDDNGYVFRYYFTTLSTQERYAAYLNELSQRSLYDTGVDVLPTDKILTLSTCSHEFDDARFVVVARQVRQGETDTVDTSLATVNSNPRYPQAYYDKKKMTNPYKDASRWEVG